MTIIELRAKRATAWEAAKAFAESHTTANGTLSAEDNATYEKMEQEIADLRFSAESVRMLWMPS